MNPFMPFLIALAVVLPVLVLVVAFLYRISRRSHPDKARLKVLKRSLWFLGALAVVYGILQLVIRTRSGTPPSAPAIWLPIATFVILAAVLLSQIHQCQKRLRRRWGRPAPDQAAPVGPNQA